MNYSMAARAELENTILPFWLENGIDADNGGFFTCFDNRGRSLLRRRKYVWSQGRFVWLLARAAGLASRQLLDLDAGRMLDLADRGAAFLLDHALKDDLSCRYVVDEHGREVPAEDDGGGVSVATDCFVAMGFAELARQTGDRRWLHTADAMVDVAADKVASGTAGNAPYTVPPGFESFGNRLVVLNARLELVRARRTLSLTEEAALTDLSVAVAEVWSHRLSDGTFADYRRRDGADAGTLLESHRVPGHALESLWMVAEAGEMLGGGSVDSGELCRSADVLCRSGWDTEHGGLFRYVGRDGGIPGGERSGSEHEHLIARTWDYKLWWVHTEAVYTTALLSRCYGDPGLERWARDIWTYTLCTFPGGTDGNEWVQIRDREGGPIDDVVALPVKDPYHIARNLMQLVELEATT